jgi:hypothetical protein
MRCCSATRRRAPGARADGAARNRDRHRTAAERVTRPEDRLVLDDGSASRWWPAGTAAGSPHADLATLARAAWRSAIIIFLSKSTRYLRVLRTERVGRIAYAR